jgi:hypothetical protein
MLVERRNIFHNSLLQIVKDQHREFLASLHPPIQVRDGIFKLLRSPGINFKESIPPAYVSWRAGTTTLFLLAF